MKDNISELSAMKVQTFFIDHIWTNATNRHGQLALATDGEGRHCVPESADAVAWSIYGAMRLILKDLNRTRLYTDLKTRAQNAGFTDIGAWEVEPGRTFDEVWAILQSVIEGRGSK